MTATGGPVNNRPPLFAAAKRRRVGAALAVAGLRAAGAGELRRWYGDIRLTQASRIAVKADGAQSLLVVTPTPGHLAAVKQAAYTLPNPSVQVTELGGTWLGPSRTRLPNWIQLFGITGLLTVTGAVTAWHSVFFIALVREGSVSWTVLAAGITTCAVVSLVVGFLGARAAAREADQWRPAAD